MRAPGGELHHRGTRRGLAVAYRSRGAPSCGCPQPQLEFLSEEADRPVNSSGLVLSPPGVREPASRILFTVEAVDVVAAPRACRSGSAASKTS